VPVGPHIADFVSFPLKTMIDLIPAEEAEPAQLARAARRKWMIEHKYRIVDVQAADVEADVKAALDKLESVVRPESLADEK
jgi:tRNA/rRNA methyltransferase